MQRRVWNERTSGKGFTELTDKVRDFIIASGVREGMCHVFLSHTSASLILGENADVAVRRDLEAFFSRLVPEGDPLYRHTAEGGDDMPAHIRTVLTQNSVLLPIRDGTPGMGTWQGLYLWEHRHAPHERCVTVSIW
jgi:secondary thiamine-phosphate synthase enzyme